MNETDETHLRRAIALAQLARDSGEQPFGSLLVGPDGAVLPEDHNTVLSDRDVTAHPELKLARWAARELDAETARSTTLYTSCQPCGMCANVIARAGLGRVVFALSSEQLSALKPPGAAPPDAATGSPTTGPRSTMRRRSRSPGTTADQEGLSQCAAGANQPSEPSGVSSFSRGAYCSKKSRATSSPRVLTSSFSKIAFRWSWTVHGEM